MRLSTVGRIILAEVCIIFNNCSVTESNDSLTLAKKRKLGGLRSYFEGGEKWKNISMDFFFLSKLHVALSRFGLKYLVQLHKKKRPKNPKQKNLHALMYLAKDGRIAFVMRVVLPVRQGYVSALDVKIPLAREKKSQKRVKERDSQNALPVLRL